MLRLQARLTLLLLAAVVLATALHGAISLWPLPQLLAVASTALGATLTAPAPWSWPALALTLALTVPLCLGLAHWAVQPLQALLRALQGAVLSYRDGDFSVSIHAERNDELGDLLRLHRELGQALREQRQQLAQRELLLDTVVQNTPLALLLCSAQGRVVYANIAARRLLAGGRSLVGLGFDAVLAAAPSGLAAALANPQDQLVSLGAVQDPARASASGPEHANASEPEHASASGPEHASASEPEHYHLSQRQLLLLGTPHRLILLRHMTRELAREEVATWKRVIRVISHELNNSLAPISSMAHSGAELARRGQLERLPQVFDSIGERARHLHSFLSSYARFAKLPQPVRAHVAWAPFIASLAQHSRFVVVGAPPAQPGFFDAAQIEQAVINLIRNAHESESPADAVTLQLQHQGGELRLEVADRGPGMSAAVLAQALLPFYSTKRSGTGLGLALVREIAEAHGGRVLLANREGGGLSATLVLPA